MPAIFESLYSAPGRNDSAQFKSLDILTPSNRTREKAAGMEENGPASGSPAPPSDETLDPDMLSIPSSSERSESRDDESRGQDGRSRGLRVFRAAFRGMLLSPQVDIEDADNGPGGKNSADTRQNPSVTSTDQSSSSSAVRNGKRKLRCNREGYGNDDGDDTPDPKRLPPQNLSQEPAGPRYLACPFWKLDSAMHWEYALKQLDTIPHLKQHLGRRHTARHYCQHCYGQFPDPGALDCHVEARSCARGSPSSLGGMSYDQRDRLSRKLAPGSKQQQWFAIWDILFDPTPRPMSIYIYPRNLVDLDNIREFSAGEGTSILAAELTANGLVLSPGVTEDQLQQVLQRGLTMVYERFIGRSHTRSHTVVEGQQVASSSNTSQIEAAAEPIMDSGLELGLSPPAIFNPDPDPYRLANFTGPGPGDPALLDNESTVESNLGFDQSLGHEGTFNWGSWELGRNLDALLGGIAESGEEDIAQYEVL